MMSRPKIIYPALFCIVILLTASRPLRAGGTDGLVDETRPLLHTFVQIKAYGTGAAKAVDAAFAEMGRVNDLLNNYDPNSEVSAINTFAGIKPVVLSPETVEALENAKRYGDISGGAFDFTIGPLLKLWGFAKEIPGRRGNEPGEKEIRAAKELVDYRALEISVGQKKGSSVKTGRLLKKGMRIDVGAFSKGFVSDRGMQVLKKHGIHNALIAAGGTICVAGTKPEGEPWQIGIRHPRKNEDMLTMLKLKDTTVSTSGDYERFYNKKGKRRSHIIDPRTGRPVARMQAVTVIAPEGKVSDALSTALFVLGTEDGLALVDTLEGVEALMVDDKGGIFYSRGWPQKVVIY